MEDVKVRIVDKVNRKEAARLYMEAGWVKPGEAGDFSFVDKIVAGSFCFAGAFHKGEMIDMGRRI